MDKFDILLVEDDEADSEAMIKEITATENFLLAKHTNSCIEAYDYIVNNHPSAVILDLEMNQGYGDGIELLTKLYAARLKHKPYIVVTTNNVSTVTINRTKQLGADYAFTKIKPDYSPKMVMDHLKAFMLLSPDELAKEIAAQRKQRLINKIYDIFNNLEIPHISGYDYLVRAIVLAVDGNENNFVELIALSIQKTQASVIKAMDYALGQAWKNTDTNKLTENYGGYVDRKKGFPPYLSFVLYYAQKLKNEF